MTGTKQLKEVSGGGREGQAHPAVAVAAAARRTREEVVCGGGG